MKLFIASAIAFALAVAPAEAAIRAPVMKVMGSQFYTQCTNPPAGREAIVIAACEAYVSGIADGLQAQGQICVGPQMTANRLLPIALVWMRNHSYNGGYPASSQIYTGLSVNFPCRPTPASRRQAASLNDRMEQFEKLVQFGMAVKSALGLIGLAG
jgi:hypothetical protein